MKRFEDYVAAFVAQQSAGFNRDAAQQALLLLYGYIASRAQEAATLPMFTLEWCKCLYQIQQVICWTPLRVFVKVLARDEQLAIRTAAKGELVDRTVTYWNDPEAGIIARVNLFMVSGLTTAVDPSQSLPGIIALDPDQMPESVADLGQEFMGETQKDERIQQGMNLWMNTAHLNPLPTRIFEPQD